MPDWNNLRNAYKAGLPNAARLGELQRLEELLNRPPEEAKAGLQNEIRSMAARELYENLLILNFGIQRDAGIVPGPDLNVQLQKLAEDVQNGSAAPARAAAAKRLFLVWEAAGEIIQSNPAVTQGPAAGEAEKTKLLQAASAVFARLQSVEGQTGPGTVSDRSVEQLQSILADGKALLDKAGPENQARPYLFYMLGSTARMLAGCYALLGRNENAVNTYMEAAGYFKDAGEPAEVEDCKQRATDLQQKLAGDLDAPAVAALARLNAPTPDADPFDCANSFIKLLEVASSAGDTFEAQQNARAAAEILTNLGYPDPLKCGLDEAADAWINKAIQTLRGVALLGRLSQVGTWYDSIAGAEFAVAILKDKVEAGRINGIQNELHKVIARFGEEAQAAAAEQAAALTRYFPNAAVKDTTTEEQKVEGKAFREFLDKCTAIDDSLARIREACNRRAGSGDSMDDLLAELQKLQAQADELNSPEYEAKTRLEAVYVLGHLGRAADMIPIAQEARRRLLAGRPDTLASLSQSHQRYLYLDSRVRELQARMMSGDLEGGLEMAEETIRDFEIQRYRVKNEFRQAALLSYVADFYKWAALGAFKLQKWDSMLAAMDLIKARSAVRNCLTPRENGQAESEAARQFKQISDELATADESRKKELEEERRRLWDLRSLSETLPSTAVELPDLTVMSLQAALSSNEAVVCYFWLNETVLLTVVADSAKFHAERIILKPPQLERLRSFIACVQTLKGPQLSMDKELAKLGQVLLPDFVRESMKGKQRVVFSPHHSLHLFPFHAVPWEDGFVGTEFAVSYVPNLSSILLPWERKSDNRVLAIAISRFMDPAVPVLRNVEADAQTIRSYYETAGAGVEMLLGADASRGRIESMRDTGELSSFRCVHLGTHGTSVFEVPNEPLESSLQLQNGPLDAMDIGNLQLNADLVVLSACNSGQRAIQLRNLGEAPGDDIFGLQAALFKSGARSILGSLWIVHVDSASMLTRSFHQHYAAGEPADFALQKSVKAYLNDDSVPHQAFYWAPFFISSIGTRRTGDTVGHGTTNVAL